ncbi:MAG TPA: DUF2752 domain-containing protein [Clostridia bacterium]|nr:DUF2752 domain-containing protein [Clostridia bacterium]
MRAISIKKRTVIILLSFAAAALLALLYFFEPVKGGIFPPCPFNYLTGLYCPGCGILRGIHSLLHGNLLKAMDYNILMVLSLPLVFYLYLMELGIKIKGKPLVKTRPFSKTFYTITITVIVVYWILRNVNIFPLNILAP